MNARKVKGVLELIRPELPFTAGIGVVIGTIIEADRLPKTFQK
jgi:hypothetical protein